MQRPILKNGVVVNVIEIDEDTAIVTKAQHKRLQAGEEEAYATELKAWREAMTARQGEMSAAMEGLGLANMTLSAVKAKAASEKVDARAALALTQILSMEAEIEQMHQGIAELKSTPAPLKPRLIRAKRWFYDDDCEVGPAGGNIGHVWNGKGYERPAKAVSAEKAIV